MKPWLIALALVAIIAGGGPLAHSRDYTVLPPPARIRVDVQMVSIPVAEAGRLVPALLDRQTAKEAWTRLQAMIANEKATLIGWPVVWVQNGERGVFESIEEDRYPTEFNPPQQPGSFGNHATLPTWGPSTPTAFETRNAGYTLEAWAFTEQDGKAIALDLVAQHVHRIATREWHTQANPAGITGAQQQPEFLTSKVAISLHARRDEPSLIGTFVVAEPTPHVELFILHARATLLPAGVVFPSPPQ